MAHAHLFGVNTEYSKDALTPRTILWFFPHLTADGVWVYQARAVTCVVNVQVLNVTLQKQPLVK
eukprot:10612267-Prorocentrum_lima.AAC.1